MREISDQKIYKCAVKSGKKYETARIIRIFFKKRFPNDDLAIFDIVRCMEDYFIIYDMLIDDESLEDIYNTIRDRVSRHYKAIT